MKRVSPYKYGPKKRKTYKSALQPKKYNPSPPPVVAYFGKQPFPKQLRNTLTYTETLSIAIVSGVGKAIFSANGLYSPNASGSLQPLYYDQLQTIYNHYTVLRSRAKFQLMGPVSGATALASYGVVAMYPDDDTTVAANAIEASSRPGAQWKSFAFATQITAPVQCDYDAVKTYGPNPMSNDNLQGSATTNPTEAMYYSAQVYDSSGASYSMYYYVNIEYDVVWDELKSIAVS